MRGDELRKRWQRAKMLGVRFHATVLATFHLFFSATLACTLTLTHTHALFSSFNRYLCSSSTAQRRDAWLRGRIDRGMYHQRRGGWLQTSPPFDHPPSSCPVVDERRLSHSNNANNAAEEEKREGCENEPSERKKVEGRYRKDGAEERVEGGGEGGNITPRVPVIRPRARDDNAKIPGHRRRFCPSCPPRVFSRLAFLRFLVISTFSPPPIITAHFSFSPFLSPEQLLNTIALSFSSATLAPPAAVFSHLGSAADDY